MKITSTKTKNQIELDWDFLFWAWDLEEKWQRSLPKLTDKELLDIFPEAKPIISEKITEWDERRHKLSRYDKKEANHHQAFNSRCGH